MNQADTQNSSMVARDRQYYYRSQCITSKSTYGNGEDAELEALGRDGEESMTELERCV